MRIINGILFFIAGAVFIELSNYIRYSNYFLIIGILSMLFGCTQIFLKHNKTKK